MNREMRKMLDKVADEYERLKRIKRTVRCPGCGEIIEGRAYPLDDLECRIQEHLREKHGVRSEEE